jgi:hypothetical protein
MAIRSGAGTGVVVSLVVFVLTTVFLLVLSIVFYAGQVKEKEAKVNAINALEVYAETRQRSTDQFQSLETQAKQQNESVSEFLQNRHASLMQFVDGAPETTIDGLQAKLTRYGIGEGDVIRNVIIDLDRQVDSLGKEVTGLKTQLTDQETLLAEREAQVEQTRQSHNLEMQAVQSQIKEYQDAAEQYRQLVDETVADLDQAKQRFRSDYEVQVSRLESENEELSRERVVLIGRVKELESATRRERLRPKDPSMLVDGRVLEAAGADDQIYIDRGKRDRIVLGMTFEVYDDEASIRVNEQTGELPRGKASLQVIKVGDTTSTCKITRSVPGRPVVRDDVIANAVYDPDYSFKFLVHGKFDLDGDGQPSEANQEYLKSLVLDWGGTVVTGKDLPGDLDFLVLGVEPPRPGILPSSASESQINDWMTKRAIHEDYTNLLQQATEAQIPVLNANRFFILIGHTNR